MQRIKTINCIGEFFDDNQSKDFSIGRGNAGKKYQDIVKLNEFSSGIERFQKALKHDSNKCQLLKKYNKVVERHFDRFQVNEDRSRKETVNHQQIIKLLLADGKQNHYNNMANAQPSRVSYSLDKEKNRKHTSLIIMPKENTKDFTTSLHCQERIRKVVDNYMKDTVERNKCSRTSSGMVKR